MSSELVTLEMLALESLYGGEVTYFSLLIKQTFVYTHRRSTTVPSETTPPNEQLLTSVSVKEADIYLAALDHYSIPLRWIIVNN